VRRRLVLSAQRLPDLVDGRELGVLRELLERLDDVLGSFVFLGFRDEPLPIVREDRRPQMREISRRASAGSSGNTL
jgi:hypothetical protein